MKNSKSNGNKRAVKTVIATVVFLAMELALLALWMNGAAYSARAAAKSGTTEVVVTNAFVERESGAYFGKSSSFIDISGNAHKYSLYLPSMPKDAPDADELIELLREEAVLTLKVKGIDTVVAVSGEDRDYLTIEQYNAYQKSQSIIGSCFFGFFALVVLAAYVISIRLIWV